MKKSALFIITIFMGITSVNAETHDVFLSLLDASSICQMDGVAQVISMVQTIITIIKIAVPIILIVSAMISYMSAIKDDDELAKVSRLVVAKVVAALLVFLIPTFVKLIADVFGLSDSINNCIELSKNPVKIQDPDKPSGGNSENNETDFGVSSINKKGAYVKINAKSKNGISGYYISKSSSSPSGKEDSWIETNKDSVDFVKLPGTYYIFVKDGKGNISKSSSFTITVEQIYNDGPKSRSGTSKMLTTEIGPFLASHGDSIENYNSFIANSVKSAGLFTADGVVTSILAAQSYLYFKYDKQIPYISNIQCTATRYNEKFGINPRWGIQIATPGSAKAKECKGSHVGFDCASLVGWSIHNGGFKAENTAGSYCGTNKAEQKSICTGVDEKRKCNKVKSRDAAYAIYDQLEIGDIIYSNQHVMLYLGHLSVNGEKAIYVIEGATPAGMKIWTYKELYSGGNYNSYYAINKMNRYYSNKSNRACVKGIAVPKEYQLHASDFNTGC